MTKKNSKRGLSFKSETSRLLFTLWLEAKKANSSKDIHFSLDRRGFLKRDFERLKKTGMIKTRENVLPNILFSFTNKGILAAVKIEIDRVFPFDDKNKACLVVFDVPEKNKAVRKRLRGYLNQWGFLPIQKSVWISSLDLIDPVVSFMKLSGLNKWVRVFVAEER
ncbi:MAG: hypothetical protein V1664_01370 [Candidatus Uhrbacteria bacterium]